MENHYSERHGAKEKGFRKNLSTVPYSTSFHKLVGYMGTVNRQETLSLLNELLATFESMNATPIVSITKVAKSPDWKLQIQWLVGRSEKIALDEIALKHGVTMKEARNCTFFR